MSYITVEQAKKHLNIDADFHDDDNYIQQLINVAEIAVERHIDYDLKAYVNQDGELSPALIHSMLLFLGNLYANRESVTLNSFSELPLAYNYLLDLFKDYTNK